MIQAVIFDMDGLLIDSEPVWEEAEIKLFNRLGVPLTAAMTKQTMGLRADEVVSYWHHRYPWRTPSQKAVTQELIDMMAELLKTEGVVRDGVHAVVDMVEKQGLPMAIASSSPRKIINAALVRIGIADKLQVIHSAEHEAYGKPHPGVYITAAEKLGVRPEFCLAFEDSPNGVLSAKAAKMKCVAVPDAKLRDSAVFGIADAVLGSLDDFRLEMLGN